MRAIVLALLTLSSLCGCRKPPAPTDPVPADAAPIPQDGGGGGGPAADGSVSDCVGLPDLSCGALAQEASAEGSLWQADTDVALDTVIDDIRPALLTSGGALCGQTSLGVVHYLGDDSQVHPVFEQMMDGWTSTPIVFDPDGHPCTTRQDFERMGIVVRLETRRAQRTFSLQVRLSP